jgi:predicted flap endonuclease-1-like 5' DNA nuclease
VSVAGFARDDGIGAKPMSYRVDKIEGIGPVSKEKLAAVEIADTATLLAKCATPAGRKAVAEKTGISPKNILKWTNMADLMRIRGVGEEFSELLEKSGVDTVSELKTRVPANLHAKMATVNAEKKLARRVPTEHEVAAWVAEAKTLAAAIFF